MYKSFKEMPAHARLWVYQSDRALTEVEARAASGILEVFCEEWKAHSQALISSFAVLHNRFLMLAVDEQYHQASGCSIDSSVAVIRELERKFDVTLFDRMRIAAEENGEIVTLHFKDLKTHISEGRLKPDTLVFDNSITTMTQLKNDWKIPASETWIGRYFKTENV